MDLFEYQAKELFKAHGVPVGLGEVAETADEARAIAERIGGVTVVKAQVKVGGRGKAGGVKVAKTPDDARVAAEAILGMDIKGHTVHRVLVDPGAADRRGVLRLVPARPVEPYVPRDGVLRGRHGDRAAGRRAARCAGPRADQRPRPASTRPRLPRSSRPRSSPSRSPSKVAAVLVPLWTAFVESDATLVEVNPLALVANGDVVALDGKVTLDDNANFRQPGNAALVDTASADPLEQKAKEKHLNYVKLDGEVGIIGNGAGLVMSTLDVVAYAGEKHGGVRPANFLDIGGGASAEVMANGLDIILGDPDVRSVFVNVFGGITACDAVANGIVAALGMLGDTATKPLVVRLDGNNVIEGRRILNEAAHPLVTMVDTMDAAADKAAELANAAQGV